VALVRKRTIPTNYFYYYLIGIHFLKRHLFCNDLSGFITRLNEIEFYAVSFHISDTVGLIAERCCLIVTLCTRFAFDLIYQLVFLPHWNQSDIHFHPSCGSLCINTWIWAAKRTRRSNSGFGATHFCRDKRVRAILITTLYVYRNFSLLQDCNISKL
jgi:hypothetical protein